MSTEPNPLPPPRSLVLKLTDIMALVRNIPKNGWNDHFKYHFAREVDVLEAVQQLFAERHILLVPSVTAQRREGKLTILDMVMTFKDGETNEEMPVPWAAQGDDSSDKGIWKAITGGVKFFILKTFLVPTGDDPEASDGDGNSTARGVKPRRQPRASQASEAPAPPAANTASSAQPADKITAEQIARLQKLIATHQVELKVFGAWLQAHYKIKKGQDILRKDYEAICAAVQNRLQPIRSLDEPQPPMTSDDIGFSR